MHRTLRLLKTVATASSPNASAAVPWYRKQFKGAQAQHMMQAGWAVSLVILFVGVPIVGATVQSHMHGVREKKRQIQNDADREEFLRELYDLNQQTKEGNGVKGAQVGQA